MPLRGDLAFRTKQPARYGGKACDGNASQEEECFIPDPWISLEFGSVWKSQRLWPKVVMCMSDLEFQTVRSRHQAPTPHISHPMVENVRMQNET